MKILHGIWIRQLNDTTDTGMVLVEENESSLLTTHLHPDKNVVSSGGRYHQSVTTTTIAHPFQVSIGRSRLFRKVNRCSTHNHSLYRSLALWALVGTPPYTQSVSQPVRLPWNSSRYAPHDSSAVWKYDSVKNDLDLEITFYDGHEGGRGVREARSSVLGRGGTARLCVHPKSRRNSAAL